MLRRQRRKLSGMAVVVASLVGLGGAPQARGETEEGMLWDRVRYGTTEKQLQSLYPDLVPSKHNAEAPRIAGLLFTSYSLLSARFGDLERCRVDFMFFRSRILQVHFRCRGVDRDKIYAELVKQFGGPTGNPEETGDISWTLGRRSVSYIPRTGAFGISDINRNKKVFDAVQQAQLMGLVGAGSSRVPPGPPATEGKDESRSDAASE